MATIKDIAKKADVSIAAVSYALNGKPGISAETREKILAIADQIGFVPNSLARGLQLKRTNIIGLVVPNIESIYTATLVKTLEENARGNGFYLLIGSTNNNPHAEREIIERFIKKNVDSFIILPGNYAALPVYRQIVDEILTRQTPVILLGYGFTGIGAHVIKIDLYSIQYEITQYLCQTGHSSIVFVSGPLHHVYTSERCRGFRDGVRDWGKTEEARSLSRRSLSSRSLPERPIAACSLSNRSVSGRHLVCGEKYSFEEGYTAVLEYLNKDGLPDAFMAINDTVAYGIIEALSETGINVPGDVSVTGFDGLPLPVPYPGYRLTTAGIPVDLLSLSCMNTLAQEMKNKEFPPVHIKIKPDLIRGNTVRIRNSKGVADEHS